MGLPVLPVVTYATNDNINYVGTHKRPQLGTLMSQNDLLFL